MNINGMSQNEDNVIVEWDCTNQPTWEAPIISRDSAHIYLRYLTLRRINSTSMGHYALAAITLAEIGANNVVIENFKWAIYVSGGFSSSYSCKFKNCYYGLYAVNKGFLSAQNFEYVCDDLNLMPNNKGIAIESRYLSDVFISGTNTISGTDTLKVKGSIIGEESTLYFNSYASLSLSNIGSYGLLLYGNSTIASARSCSLSIDGADKGIYFYSGVASNSFIFDKSRVTMTNVTEEYFGMKENKLNSLNNRLMLGNEPLSFEGWEGDTASRPTLIEANGQPYFDTDLGQPIWWNGTDWVDALGNDPSTVYVVE
jgi:hypothetical protein